MHLIYLGETFNHWNGQWLMVPLPSRRIFRLHALFSALCRLVVAASNARCSYPRAGNDITSEYWKEKTYAGHWRPRDRPWCGMSLFLSSPSLCLSLFCCLSLSPSSFSVYIHVCVQVVPSIFLPVLFYPYLLFLLSLSSYLFSSPGDQA